MLVTIDTLRADRLGCYGSRDVATPHLDRLAREGAHGPRGRGGTSPSRVRPTSRCSPASTPPSTASGTTSRRRSRRTCRRWPRCSRARAFDTAASSPPIVLSAQSGLDRGLRHVLGQVRRRRRRRALPEHRSRSAATCPTAEAIAWLESQGGGEAVSLAASLRSRTTPTSRPSRTPVAMRSARTTGRWRGPTSWWAGSTPPSRGWA